MDKVQERTFKLLGYSVEELKGMKTIPRITLYNKEGRRMEGLPSDPYHIAKYIGRGFTKDPPPTEPQKVSPDGFICETCGKGFPIALALAGHSRSHKGTKEI